MRIAPTVGILSSAVALVVNAACGNGPTSPQSTQGSSSPPSPLATRLEVEGPVSVAPGDTAQFSVTVHFSDGTSRELTTGAFWRSSNPTVFSVDAGTGLGTAHERGDSTVTVAVDSARMGSSKQIIVVPAGTYRVVGVVTEAPGPAGPVAGATVEVLAGVSTGLRTETGLDGRYRLYGVPDGAEIRVSKDGYEPRVLPVTVRDHQTLDIELSLTQERLEIAGSYTLTIAAADECRNELPPEVRTRTYSVDLGQNGNELEARLTGAKFAVSRQGAGNRFRGRLEPRQLLFLLNSFDPISYGYYQLSYGDVVEEIGDGIHLVISGSVRVTGSEDHFSGTLDGAFEIYRGALAVWPTRGATCRSADHRFVLAGSSP